MQHSFLDNHEHTQVCGRSARTFLWCFDVYSTLPDSKTSHDLWWKIRTINHRLHPPTLSHHLTLNSPSPTLLPQPNLTQPLPHPLHTSTITCRNYHLGFISSTQPHPQPIQALPHPYQTQQSISTFINYHLEFISWLSLAWSFLS